MPFGNLYGSIHLRIILIILSPQTFLDKQTRSGELRTYKLKSHLFKTQSLKVLPLEPGVDQYIAIHATPTARDFFLPYFHPSGPFTCIFSKACPNFFSCVGCG